MTKLSLDEAKTLLASSSREQLVDPAFGDAEVYWFINGEEVASGYFGRSAEVGFNATLTYFNGREAEELRYCGTLTLSERNDAGGDHDSY